MSNQKKEEILKLLFPIWEDEEFATEVMRAISGNAYIADKLLEFLNTGPELVPSEVYDELAVLTAGKFVKEFPTIRSVKKACIDSNKLSEWNELFEELSNAELFIVSEWNLSDEEKEIILKANIGDTVHIDTRVEPLILKDPNSNVVMIPVYTSNYEIPCEYRAGEYVIQQVDWTYVEAIYNACSRVIGKSMIVLDIDSDDFLEMTDEKLSLRKSRKT